MKLQQLRYLAAIVENDLNITAAAERLHTSQPGVSKQLKQLEDELGFPIFLRQGRTLTRVTPAGKRVIDRRRSSRKSRASSGSRTSRRAMDVGRSRSAPRTRKHATCCPK
jgi:DNA-binding transcriptional LysR family regulator